MDGVFPPFHKKNNLVLDTTHTNTRNYEFEHISI